MPTTPGIASNSLSCARRTSLMSRRGDGELFCAIAWLDRNTSAASAPKRKAPVRANERVLRSFRLKLGYSDHGRVEETQHLADRVGNGGAAAARKEQADRARIRCYIFDHQRTGIAAV